MLLTKDPILSRGPRERCYGCFRPTGDCFCAAIPTIDNRTNVLILQHVRERFHAFNTARIVERALTNSRLVVGAPRELAQRLVLKPRAGLLYPGPAATLLGDVPADQRPEQLVVLDGTWHHAKTLVRDIAALGDLPRYRLAPAAPSRYRIRREPIATYLSTVEATVAALRVLEPETRGFEQLLSAFDGMVERQLAHPKSQYGWRRIAGRNRIASNIPSAILGDLNCVVVAYGESTAGRRGCKDGHRAPVYWVAERVGTGERFACSIQSGAPLQDSFLRHLELTPAHFAQALSPTEVRRRWAAFERPSDTLAVYHQGTARLFTQITAGSTACLVLKSIDFNPLKRYATLDELVTAEGLASGPAQHPGRAGKRLANVVALVEHLNTLGNDACSAVLGG